ncbi:hypothetical protein EKTHUN627_32480 [Enterobacter kobei]|nr:hypothetical protein EKTHUN627_32480 [Enterobacter kobei]
MKLNAPIKGFFINRDKALHSRTVNNLIWLVRNKIFFQMSFLILNFCPFMPINEDNKKIDVIAVKKAKDDPTSDHSWLYGC